MSEPVKSGLTQEAWADEVTRLYEAYADDVLRVSYFYLNDRGRAEDVMQEVFSRLFTKQPTLEEGREKAWLLKVALNLCRDHWRSAWVKRVLVGPKLLEIIPGEDDIEQVTDKEALMQAVHALTPKLREVIILNYYQGYSTEDMMRLLDLPQGTISSRLSRARLKLKEILEKGEGA